MDSLNAREEIWPVHQDLLRAGHQLRLRPHWQREQRENGIILGLLAQLLKSQPVHASKERLQLQRQQGWAEVETPVRHHHNHGEMLHLGVELRKARCLRPQAVLEPGLGVHLHLEQHHGLIRQPASPLLGQNTPSRRWFTALSSGASNRYSASPEAPGPRLGTGRAAIESAAGNSSAIRSGALWNRP